MFVFAVGEEANSEYVQEGAAMAFDVFKDSKHVTNAATIKLRGIFGPFPASAATRACQLVNQMILWLPDHVLESLSDESHKAAAPNTSARSVSQREFGTGIKFDSAPAEEEELEEYWFGSESETSDNEFDMRYENLPQAGQATGDDFSTGWLKSEMEKAFAGSTMGMPLIDMCRSVFDLLSSPKSDSELQNDVCTFSCLLLHI